MLTGLSTEQLRARASGQELLTYGGRDQLAQVLLANWAAGAYVQAGCAAGLVLRRQAHEALKPEDMASVSAMCAWLKRAT